MPNLGRTCALSKIFLSSEAVLTLLLPFTRSEVGTARRKGARGPQDQRVLDMGRQ